jgi:serine/threonine-protein kinase
MNIHVRHPIRHLIFFMLLLFVATASVVFRPLPGMTAEQAETLIVTAEGLVDPNSEMYKKDKGLMIDDLRRDAQRQAIEKAVGVYVESSTLVENYLLIEDKVLSKSKGLIKQILEQSSPRLGEDGLMHLQIKAEVFISEVKTALQSLSRESRLSLIRERGNPTISVAVVIRDARRSSDTAPENSTIAENILKEHFVDFGYRVWSEEYTRLLHQDVGAGQTGRKIADFSVIGEAKFKQTSITLKASGIQVTKHVLTSWTVKCINNHTGEEIYFNNKVPKNKSWADEDQALEDIGRLIGDEFSKDFFETELMKPSQKYQIQLTGLPDYDTALLFKDEFVGLRTILNADLLNFEMNGLSIYEVECTGSGGNFAQVLNNTILKPLNAKLDGPRMQLMSQHGNVVRVAIDPGSQPELLQKSMQQSPPASLVTASPERIAKLITDPELLDKVIRMNPGLGKNIKDSEQ